MAAPDYDEQTRRLGSSVDGCSASMVLREHLVP